MAFYNEKDDNTNFVIGFSSNPQQDFGKFAEGYHNAAKQQAENLLAEGQFSDNNAYPVVFLYRHAFELYLKSYFYKFILIRFFSKESYKWENFVTHHRLTPLAKFLVASCEQFFPDDSDLLKKANEINKFAIEFDQIDENSLSYRYPIDTLGNYSTSSHQSVNLNSFYQNMEYIMNDLKIFDFGLDIETNKRQLNFELMEEAKKFLDIK